MGVVIKAGVFCLALGLVGVLAWRVLVRRTGWGSVSTLLLCLAAALCLALTVPQAIAPGTGARLGRCLSDPAGGIAYSVRIFGTRGLEDAMNVLLWVPPGLFGVIATRRPWSVLGGISLGMLIIELLQTLDPGRECDPGDWLYNTAGGLVGIALGWLFLRARPISPPVESGTLR
jgi:VanZ like family